MQYARTKKTAGHRDTGYRRGARLETMLRYNGLDRLDRHTAAEARAEMQRDPVEDPQRGEQVRREHEANLLDPEYRAAWLALRERQFQRRAVRRTRRVVFVG